MALNDAVPSSATDVFKRNAEDADRLLNATGNITTRTGKILPSWDEITQSHAAWNNSGAWTTATAYAVNDIWESAGVWYVVLSAYTSGASAAADIAGPNIAVLNGNFGSAATKDTGTDFDQIPLNSDIVYPVATIADLRLLEPTRDGQRIDILGHTLAGIGGGQFYYDPDDTTSADNNGTVIVTSGGHRWKRKLGAKFLAEWFGVDKSLPDNYAAIIKAYDAAEAARYDALCLPTNGGDLTITDTIPLKRGVALIGGSTIDDQSGTVLKRGDNMDVPMVATPKWFSPGSPVDASYFVILGVTLDGNRDNQTVLQPAMALWGAFVGSVLDDVFVINNYGPMMSNEYAYDINIGLLYGNGCVVGSGGVWEIDQLDVAEGPIGLIEAESVYIENPRVTIGGGIPQSTPANRGEGIRVGNIGRLHIGNLHQEACDVNLHVTHGTNEIIKIGARSSAHSGDPARLHSDVYLSSGITNLDLGPTKVFSPDASFNWLDMTSGVKSSNLYPTVSRTQARWGGCNLTSPGSDEFVTTGVRHMADLEQRKISAASQIQSRNYISETNDDLFHFDQYAGGVVTRGSRVNQGVEKAFETLNSFGGPSDNFTDLVPRKLVIQDSTSVSNALYITSGNLLRITINGVEYNVGLTAV